jgi:chromosomal replication initiation ATPase DnaA
MKSTIKSCQASGCLWPAELCQPTKVLVPGVGELEVLLCSWDADRVTAGLASVEQELAQVGRVEDEAWDDSSGERALLTEAISATRSMRGVQVIQQEVADYYSLVPADLKGPRRTRDMVLPRHVAMYLVRTETPASLPVIGDAFGERDHTTVLHAVRKIAALLETDEQLRHEVEVIRLLLNGRPHPHQDGLSEIAL